ncbi:hypothetical protein [Streptomyces wuyuanensis]|uniref:hypothetical protein n=1 Tax=Streptomyces wuyuanensis TaxID=1196353 RepID=UPI003710F3EB
MKHPLVIKEVHAATLKEAAELAESATHLGLGVHIANSMHRRGEDLTEMWDVVLTEDIPLHDEASTRAAALERFEARRKHSSRQA